MATFYNQATLTYRGGATNSNIVTGEFREVLSANKVATTENYALGEELTYLVNIINTGTSTLTALSVTDDLGAYPVGTGTQTPLTYVEGSALYFVDGVLQSAPTVTSRDPLIVSGLSVPAGSNALLLYRALPNAFAPLAVGSTITNTATITGPGVPTPVRASETVTVQSGTALSITKSLSPTEIVGDGALTYTFLLENRGNTPAVATDDLVVSDLFDPILTITAVTLNGTPLVEGTDFNYDPVTGSFATVPGVITLPAATAVQNPDGSYTVTPGSATLTVSGSI